jgi:hypothetical protein
VFFFLDKKERKNQGKTIAARLSNFLTDFRLHLESPKIGSLPHGIAFCHGLRAALKKIICISYDYANYIICKFVLLCIPKHTLPKLFML